MDRGQAHAEIAEEKSQRSFRLYSDGIDVGNKL